MRETSFQLDAQTVDIFDIILLRLVGFLAYKSFETCLL